MEQISQSDTLGFLALLTAAIGAFFSWKQVKDEREMIIKEIQIYKEWITEGKKSTSLFLYTKIENDILDFCHLNKATKHLAFEAMLGIAIFAAGILCILNGDSYIGCCCIAMSLLIVANSITGFRAKMNKATSEAKDNFELWTEGYLASQERIRSNNDTEGKE